MLQSIEEVKVYAQSIEAANKSAEAYARNAARVARAAKAAADPVAFVKPENGYVANRYGVEEYYAYEAYTGAPDAPVTSADGTETRYGKVVVTLWDLPEAAQHKATATKLANAIREAVADRGAQSREAIAATVQSLVRRLLALTEFGSINLSIDDDKPATFADKWNERDNSDFMDALYTKDCTFSDSADPASKVRRLLTAKFAKVVNRYADVNAVRVAREAKAAKAAAKRAAKAAAKPEEAKPAKK